ncbi:DNA alkylation repair protein [Streptococcus sp. CSL10205-OR2]|uniref:DNA alkylation repair protein n=1 Tax=Streptococcus sp. CSL10205-OR2 TaxID=2980558 RepID=UPI0021D9F732|nr:DNA alkylation repair protein [Streptococcus sp. CSL10205-OR2]MCU9533275.1 DNA alkylation repair protein [Streptococcus sp. CSL10205-OR2]
MAKKVKDYYDIDYLKMMSNKIAAISNDFNSKKFLELTRNSIEQLEFNQRQDLIAKALYESINLGYEETLLIFYEILGDELKGNAGAFSEGWWLWPIGKYVERYGEDYLEASLSFSKELTKRFTSEYCMRPLIKKYPKETMKVLEEWSMDANERVRRLSSECLRIRLPWAKKLYTALDYFDQYYKILTNLKDDKDKYIQKSVANNLNDLYKEDEEKFYFIVRSWEKGDLSKESKWVIKHGSRNVK